MVDRDVFDRRLAKLEDLLRQLRGLAEVEKAAVLADDRVRASAERWLQVAAECCLDLAHHLIADQGWKTPSTYREAFEILHKENVLDRETARQMALWAGLRNVLVHLYLEVEPERLYQILQEDLDQLESFAAQISRAAG